MNKVLYEIKLAAKQAPKLYFAPFVGAVLGIKMELRKLRLPRESEEGHLAEGENKEKG
jgi:hypothetical protein